jgi:hypothetical protein
VTLAVATGAVARDVAETTHTDPTVGEAAEAFFGQATHIHTGRR